MALDYGEITPTPEDIAPPNGKAPAKKQPVTVSPPNFKYILLTLRGTAPYVQARFSEKALLEMAAGMEAGSTTKKGKKREARDFEADYHAAMHLTPDGKHGIPAAAFRKAAIDACRTTGFAMTRAKMSVFIIADGFDVIDGTPLVFIEGTPERLTLAVRNATGVPDIRMRPMWRDWTVRLHVQFDADQFTTSDAVNLFLRAGVQVGVGEGRPYSRMSCGLGYGTFHVNEVEELRVA